MTGDYAVLAACVGCWKNVMMALVSGNCGDDGVTSRMRLYE